VTLTPSTIAALDAFIERHSATPNQLPTRDDVTTETRAIWAEVLGVPPEHVESFLFDLPGSDARLG
jgi:hypothetical protein